MLWQRGNTSSSQLGARPTEVISTEDVSTQSSWTWIWKFFSPLLFVFYRKKQNKTKQKTLSLSRLLCIMKPDSTTKTELHFCPPQFQMTTNMFISHPWWRVDCTIPRCQASGQVLFLSICIKIWVRSRQTLPSRLINLQSKLNTVWREIQKTKKQKNKNYSPLCSAQMFLAACKPLKHSLWNSVWANSQRRSL